MDDLFKKQVVTNGVRQTSVVMHGRKSRQIKELQVLEAQAIVAGKYGEKTRMRLYDGIAKGQRKFRTLVNKGPHVEVVNPKAIAYHFNRNGRDIYLFEAKDCIVYGYLNHHQLKRVLLATVRKKQYLAAMTNDPEFGRLTIEDENRIIETMRLDAGIMVNRGRAEYGTLPV